MHTETRIGKAGEEGSPKRNQQNSTDMSALHQSRPGSLQLVSDAGSTAAPSRSSLETMTPNAARAWLASMRERLEKKMVRERAYLDRRAARGTHTPTDDAYAEDQRLEAELLDLLEQCMQSL